MMHKSEFDNLEREGALQQWSDIPHELRNLLQVVVGYLGMLKNRTDDAPSLGYIENAQSAVSDLTQLAERIALHLEK